MVAPWHVNQLSRPGKVMLIGVDQKQILEKRFLDMGCRVMTVKDWAAAVDFARHETFDGAVLVCQGSLINVAETIFNLKDLNRSIEIVLLIQSPSKHPKRLLRQLLEHPIEGTRILTRRELQRELHSATRPSAGGYRG